MVAKNWAHPKYAIGNYIPLKSGYIEAVEKFLELFKTKGALEATEYFGGYIIPAEYMPIWDKSEATHFMMYEDCTEGTPISPAFETVEELAHWLADNGASAFGHMTATYEQWLATCKRGWACSAVVTADGLKSGVGC